MTLIQQLVKKGILEKEKAASLEFEIKESGKREEEAIVEKGIVSEQDLFALKGDALKIPLKNVISEEVSLETLEIIPEETAKHYSMLPLFKKEKELQIGMVYPEDLNAQEALKFLARQAGLNYQVFLITPGTFNNLLKQYRTLKKEVGRALEELKEEIKTEEVPKTLEEFERFAAEAPITKIVAVILKHAVEGKASDIHIEPTREKLRIRFRLTGTLHTTILLPLKIHPAIVARIKILSNLRLDETRIPQDGRFSTRIDDKNIDYRVSTLPTSLGEKVVIRVLDPLTGLKKFEELGLAGRDLGIIKKAISQPYGMILATGPTGSGKTTTLYSILQSLNKEGVNIITLEDPIEYFIEGVNQSQIRPEIGYGFAQGLRHVLRQDPNIIMVGEIRDEETASLATHAALTGHIVLSTLHTNNAIGVIPRLIDLGIKPYLIPPTLSVALAQRLVRKLCPECKKEVEMKKEIRDMVIKEMSDLPSTAKSGDKAKRSFRAWQAVGCRKCGDEGFSGRIALYEVLSMTDQIADIVLKQPSEAAIAKEAKRQGMITMRQDGILKALEGVTTIEEVLRVTEEV